MFFNESKDNSKVNPTTMRARNNERLERKVIISDTKNKSIGIQVNKLNVFFGLNTSLISIPINKNKVGGKNNIFFTMFEIYFWSFLSNFLLFFIAIHAPRVLYIIVNPIAKKVAYIIPGSPIIKIIIGNGRKIEFGNPVQRIVVALWSDLISFDLKYSQIMTTPLTITTKLKIITKKISTRSVENCTLRIEVIIKNGKIKYSNNVVKSF